MRFNLKFIVVFFFVFSTALLVNSFLFPNQLAPLVSLAEKNKQADRAYLNWRLDEPGSSVSEAINASLNDDAREFIVQESQLPLDRLLSSQELQKKVHEVTDSFMKKFNLESTFSRSLEDLVGALILPEYLLHIDPSLTEESDITYNAFMRILRRYKTPAGTQLYIWALRFLTSESQIVAINVLVRYTKEDKTFNALDAEEKQKILDLVSEVVARRFITTIAVVKEEFGFEVPPHLYMALKERLSLFLYKKFIS